MPARFHYNFFAAPVRAAYPGRVDAVRLGGCITLLVAGLALGINSAMALERVRDLAAEGQIQVVLAYAPDRLTRKYAYQILLIEEFARHGSRGAVCEGSAR